MSVREVNKALMELLGIDPNSDVTEVEIIMTGDNYPKVTVTRLLFDPTWKTEARMFELVPYNHQL